MAANREELKKAIERGKISLPPDVKVSPACFNLIKSLLVQDVDNRIDWKNFFEHPFVKSDEKVYQQYYNTFLNKL